MNRPNDHNNNWFRLVGQIVDPLDSTNSRYPTSNDVLLGRGRGNQRHTGNIDFLRKIDQNLDLYHRQKRGNKKKIVTMIIEWVRDRNGSFLRQTFAGNWVEADESAAKEKVAQAFRHGKHRQQESTPGAAKGYYTEKRSGNLKLSNDWKRASSEEAFLDVKRSAMPGKFPPVQDMPDGKECPEATIVKAKSDREYSAAVAIPDTKVPETEDARDVPASAIGACTTDLVQKPCMKDAEVFKLLSDYPSRSQIAFKESESPICEDASVKGSSISHPSGVLSKLQKDRSVSDEIVSDAEILAAIKAWDD